MNRQLHTPFHRVMMTGDKAKYSAGNLFSFFKAGDIVKVPQELVDEEQPLQYKPFDYSEFQEFRQREAGKGQGIDYCGV